MICQLLAHIGKLNWERGILRWALEAEKLGKYYRNRWNSSVWLWERHTTVNLNEICFSTRAGCMYCNFMHDFPFATSVS